MTIRESSFLFQVNVGLVPGWYIFVYRRRSSTTVLCRENVRFAGRVELRIVVAQDGCVADRRLKTPAISREHGDHRGLELVCSAGCLDQFRRAAAAQTCGRRTSIAYERVEPGHEIGAERIDVLALPRKNLLKGRCPEELARGARACKGH